MAIFKRVDEKHRKVADEDFMLPLRATKNASGYDFYAIEDLVIPPGDKVFFWTDVKVEMSPTQTCLLDVRSSIGQKKDLMLTTTIGNCDSDYANNIDNDGNIGIGLRNLKPSIKLEGYYVTKMPLCLLDNDELIYDETTGDTLMSEPRLFQIPVVKDLREENTIFIPKGERVAQAIIVEYVTAENCNSDNERVGGYGSSGK